MNYEKMYENLIETRNNRILDEKEYYEKHHIIPKCLGGSDKKENLIHLTAKEHFIAHHLLYKCAKDKNEQIKLGYAIIFLCYGNEKQTKKKITARQYEIAKKILSNNMKGTCYAKGLKHGPVPEERKIRISKALKSVPKTLEHGKNISLGMKNKIYPEERRQNIANSIIGTSIYLNLETNERKRFLKDQQPEGWIKYKIVSNNTDKIKTVYFVKTTENMTYAIKGKEKLKLFCIEQKISIKKLNKNLYNGYSITSIKFKDLKEIPNDVILKYFN